jgi:hypothetical protein
MEPFEKLEASLDDTLRTKAPVSIPRDWAKMVACNLWWIALLLGVLQLYTAIDLWDWGHSPVDGITAINYYTTGVARHLGLFFYLAVFSSAAVAVFLLLGAAPLKAMRKSGWNMLFYGVLMGVLSTVFILFSDGGGARDFVTGVIESVVAAYLLFQVREYFIMSHHDLGKKPGHAADAVRAIDVPETELKPGHDPKPHKKAADEPPAAPHIPQKD